MAHQTAALTAFNVFRHVCFISDVKPELLSSTSLPMLILKGFYIEFDEIFEMFDELENKLH